MNKLIYIANARLPTEKAHGLQIMRTCEALAAQGVRVELVVPRRRNYLRADPFSFYDLASNFVIKKLPCLDFLNFKFFKRLGFWLENFTFCLAVIIDQLASRDKSVIYYTRDWLVARWLPNWLGPIFYEIHTLPASITSLHHQAWRRCHGLVVISDGLKKALINEGVSEQKILLARDAVDLGEFNIKQSRQECRAKLGLPVEQKIVLYTGHLYDWKGASLLAEAAKFLPEEITIYLVGGTPEDIKAFKNKYTFFNLHIIGWQEPRLIPCWLKAANRLILPSSGQEPIGAVYTSPLKLFEYMASGTPILAARLDSVREVLTEEDGQFFTPDNVEDLARAIVDSFHPKEMSEFAKRAQAAAVKAQQYTWQARADRIIKFIQLAI